MTLFWVIVAGATVGVVFDFYRSFRSWQGWRRVLTFVGDLTFSIIALIILFRFFERANALAFRFYTIWGSLLGLVIYLRLFSNYVVSFFLRIFELIAYIAFLICRGIKIPFRGLVHIMQPPFAVLRWLGLLLYRIGEYIFLEVFMYVNKRLKTWWNLLFPPSKDE